MKPAKNCTNPRKVNSSKAEETLGLRPQEQKDLRSSGGQKTRGDEQVKH